MLFSKYDAKKYYRMCKTMSACYFYILLTKNFINKLVAIICINIKILKNLKNIKI